MYKYTNPFEPTGHCINEFTARQHDDLFAGLEPLQIHSPWQQDTVDQLIPIIPTKTTSYENKKFGTVAIKGNFEKEYPSILSPTALQNHNLDLEFMTTVLAAAKTQTYYTAGKGHIRPLEFQPGQLLPEYSTSSSAMDKAVRTELGELLSEIDLAAIMVPSSHKPIKDPDSFRLIPVLSGNPSYGQPASMHPCGHANYFEQSVRCTYRTSISTPYLDVNQAVGLVYGDHLIAVAGAGVRPGGDLMIVQIQDVSGIHKDGDKKAFYKSGLHNGFKWRDSLVRAWEEIGAKIGANGVVIQSHKNNRWPAVIDRGHSAYDAVADRMGYIQSMSDKNWYKEIAG